MTDPAATNPTGQNDDPAGLRANPAPASPERPRLKMSKLAIALITASVLAVAGWTTFGVTASNLSETQSAAGKTQSTAEERIETLQADAATLESELDEMTESRDEFKDASDAVTAMEKTLAERDAAVTGREEAITAKEIYIQSTTLKDGMYYTVGVSMEPGTYQTTSSSGRCYWKITKAGTNYDDIIENDLGGMGILTVAVGGGQDFQSSTCGDWAKIG